VTMGEESRWLIPRDSWLLGAGRGVPDVGID
jgi:hypothetical protein